LRALAIPGYPGIGALPGDCNGRYVQRLAEK